MDMRKKHRRLVGSSVWMGWLPPLGLLGTWCCLALWGGLPASLLVPPWTVLSTAFDLAASGGLGLHLGVSLLRVLCGFAVGAGLGVCLGLLFGLHRGFRVFLRPMVMAVQQVPLFAWMPLLIVLLGIEEGSKLAFIAFGCFFPAWMNSFEGVVSLPVRYQELAAVHGLGQRERLLRMDLPWAMPSLLAGLRLSFSLAWMLVVGAELFGSDAGIGYLMTWGRQMYQIDVVLVGVLVIGIIGVLANRGLGRLESHLLRWRKSHAQA